MRMIYWTVEQDQYLLDSYGRVDTRDIAKRVGKSTDAVYGRARKINARGQAGYIRRGKECHFWSDEEIALLIKWHRKKTRKELGAMLRGRSIHTIAGKMYELGLKKRMAHYDGKVWVKRTVTGAFQVRIYKGGRMMSYAQWVWFKHHDEIPKSMVVVPKDGHPLHCRRIEDLLLVSRRLQLYKNHPRLTREEAVAYDLIAEIKDLHNIKRRRK